MKAPNLASTTRLGRWYGRRRRWNKISRPAVFVRTRTSAGTPSPFDPDQFQEAIKLKTTARRWDKLIPLDRHESRSQPILTLYITDGAIGGDCSSQSQDRRYFDEIGKIRKLQQWANRPHCPENAEIVVSSASDCAAYWRSRWRQQAFFNGAEGGQSLLCWL